MTASEPLSDSNGRGLLSARPTAGIAGRRYHATDTGVIYRDNGTTWDTETAAGVGAAVALSGGFIPGLDGVDADPWPIMAGGVAAASGGAALTVEEVDGSPTDAAITKIVFPNDSVSIASHVATIRQVPYGFIGCYAERTTDQTGIVTATDTQIAFNAADIFDSDGFHDPASNNTRFTVPAGLGGKYLVTASAIWDANGSGIRQMWLKHTGIGSTAGLVNGFGRVSPAAGYPAIVSTAILDMKAGDYVEVNIYQDSGSNRTVSGSVVPLTFSIAKLDAGRVGQGIGAKVYNVAGTTIPGSTETAIPYANEEYDTDGFHDNVTANTKLIIPAGLGGKYLITLQVTIENGNGSYVAIRKNGSALSYASYVGRYSPDSPPGYNAVQIMDLAAGDYVEAIVFQVGGTTLTTNATYSYFNSFTIARLDSGGSAYTGPRWGSGTAFPSGPVSGDQFLRTDLNIDFFYDGTRWLSKTLYRETFTLAEALFPIAASSTVGRWAPWHTDYDLWLDAFYVTNFVNGTNDGSNNWTVALAKYTAANAATTVASYSTSADAASTWVTHKVAIGAVLATGTHKQMQTGGTKVGSPGTLYMPSAITYRLIGV